MIPLAVYDTMIFFQWATLPPDEPDRVHQTVRALIRGDVRLAMSLPLLDEIRRVLSYPELQRVYPVLTEEHISAILSRLLEFAEVFDPVPAHFSLVRHNKDDHILNLAIESKARYLVTWETRLLKFANEESVEAERFRELAPLLTILNPPAFGLSIRSN